MGNRRNLSRALSASPSSAYRAAARNVSETTSQLRRVRLCTRMSSIVPTFAERDDAESIKVGVPDADAVNKMLLTADYANRVAQVKRSEQYKHVSNRLL